MFVKSLTGGKWTKIIQVKNVPGYIRTSPVLPQAPVDHFVSKVRGRGKYRQRGSIPVKKRSKGGYLLEYENDYCRLQKR